MTGKQDVVTARREIAALKTTYAQAVQSYTDAAGRDPTTAKMEVLDVQRRGTEYFSFVENFVGDSDLLGAHQSANWIQGFAEDCAEVLGSMPGHFALLTSAFERIPELKGLNARPGATAYASMQRMVVAYLTDEIAQKLRVEFESADLPVYGFDHEARLPMNKVHTTWAALIVGIILIAVVMVIAWFLPEPSGFQSDVYRIVLAIALAGVAAIIPGFLEVKFKNWLRATGAIAVFVIAFFFNPAARDAREKPGFATPAASVPTR